MKQNNLKIIGLTGGIASGKSTVSSFIKSKGYRIIDADQIARDVVKKGSQGLKAIEKTFGKEILNSPGSLNRKKLRKIVFNDEKALMKLEGITHPLIIAEIKKNIKKLNESDTINLVFLECPLLFEMSLDTLVDEVWLVVTTLHNQITRIVNRDASSIFDAKNIINQQMSLEEKTKRADVVIENNASIKALKIKTETLLKGRC